MVESNDLLGVMVEKRTCNNLNASQSVLKPCLENRNKDCDTPEREIECNLLKLEYINKSGLQTTIWTRIQDGPHNTPIVRTH